jgi:hypothetical protein
MSTASCIAGRSLLVTFWSEYSGLTAPGRVADLQPRKDSQRPQLRSFRHLSETGNNSFQSHRPADSDSPPRRSPAPRRRRRAIRAGSGLVAVCSQAFRLGRQLASAQHYRAKPPAPRCFALRDDPIASARSAPGFIRIPGDDDWFFHHSSC